MNIQRADPSQIEMYVSREELLLINNALNEVCNGLHFSDGDFFTRLGRPRAEAQELRAQVQELFRAGHEPDGGK